MQDVNEEEDIAKKPVFDFELDRLRIPPSPSKRYKGTNKLDYHERGIATESAREQNDYWTQFETQARLYAECPLYLMMSFNKSAIYIWLVLQEILLHSSCSFIRLLVRDNPTVRNYIETEVENYWFGIMHSFNLLFPRPDEDAKADTNTSKPMAALDEEEVRPSLIGKYLLSCRHRADGDESESGEEDGLESGVPLTVAEKNKKYSLLLLEEYGSSRYTHLSPYSWELCLLARRAMEDTVKMLELNVGIVFDQTPEDEKLLRPTELIDQDDDGVHMRRTKEILAERERERVRKNLHIDRGASGSFTEAIGQRQPFSPAAVNRTNGPYIDSPRILLDDPPVLDHESKRGGYESRKNVPRLWSDFEDVSPRGRSDDRDKEDIPQSTSPHTAYDTSTEYPSASVPFNKRMALRADLDDAYEHAMEKKKDRMLDKEAESDMQEKLIAAADRTLGKSVANPTPTMEQWVDVEAREKTRPKRIVRRKKDRYSHVCREEELAKERLPERDGSDGSKSSHEVRGGSRSRAKVPSESVETSTANRLPTGRRRIIRRTHNSPS